MLKQTQKFSNSYLIPKRFLEHFHFLRRFVSTLFLNSNFAILETLMGLILSSNSTKKQEIEIYTFSSCRRISKQCLYSSLKN